MKKIITIIIFTYLFSTSISLAETTMSQEGQYIFNSLAFYIGGVLVAFMAAGFCMLESGLVTTKSVSTIAAKNIGKFAICSLVFFLVGTLRLVLSNNVCLCYRFNRFWCSGRENKNLAIFYICCIYGRFNLSNFHGLAIGWRLVKHCRFF